MDWTGWGQALMGGLVGSVIGGLGTAMVAKRSAVRQREMAKESAVRLRAAAVVESALSCAQMVREDRPEMLRRTWSLVIASTALRMELGSSHANFREALKDRMVHLLEDARLWETHDLYDLLVRYEDTAEVISRWVSEGMPEWSGSDVDQLLAELFAKRYDSD